MVQHYDWLGALSLLMKKQQFRVSSRNPRPSSVLLFESWSTRIKTQDC